MTPDGLVTCLSSFGSKETMDRLAAAVEVGLALRPTEVMIFGNPLAGASLIQKAQTIGIDLPLKALVRQDDEGKTWLAYNDPPWLARRHGAEVRSDTLLVAMTDALAGVAKEATTPVAGNAS